MKPSTANSGSVTTPTDWTLVAEITGAGGYGTTLGADTGNTNLFVYTRTVPAGALSGSLAVTVATNNICWGIIGRLRSDATNPIDVVGWTSSDTTAGDVSATFATGTGLTANDQVFGAMVIPTDVTTPAQFSAQAFSATGVTFGTLVEVAEADSTTGNDIGGFIVRNTVSSGTSSGDTTLTATAGGTTTDVRGALVLIRARESIGNSYTLVCDGATYSLSGQAVGLLFKRRLISDGATYSYTAQTVNVAFGRRLVADGASYSYSAQNVGLIQTHRLVADPATYAFAGQGVGVLFGRRLVADGTTYTLIGQAVNLALGRRLVCDGATYSYAVQDANLLQTHRLIADPATYSMTVGDMGFVYQHRMTADPATYVFTGQDIILSYDAVGSFTLGAFGASYALTLNDANLALGRRLVCDGATYSYSGQAVGVLRGYRLVSDGLTYTLSAQTANLLYARRMVSDGATYSYAGQAVNVLFGRKLIADGATYAYSGQDLNFILTVALRNVFLGSVKASKVYVNGNQVLKGYIGDALFWNTLEPPNTIRALGATYAMTLAEATLRHGYKMPANGASYTMSLGQCAIKRSRIMIASGATYSMTVGAVTLTKLGAIVNPLLGGSVISDVAYELGDADAYLTFNANGTISATATPDFAVDTVNGQKWFTTAPDQTYQIFATQISTSGTGNLSGTIGSWLSFPQTWGVEKLGGANGTKNRVLRFQIRRQSDSTIVSNGTHDYTLACSTNTGLPE